MKLLNSSEKIIFSDKVVSIINAMSLLFTYIIIGLIIYYDNHFFGNVTKAIEVGFVVLGFIGVVTELRNLNRNYKIKGLDNVIISGFLALLLFLLKNHVNIVDCNKYFVFAFQLMSFFLLLLTIFLVFRGIISIIYSISLKTSNNSIGVILSNIILMILQVISLFILVLLIFDCFIK